MTLVKCSYCGKEFNQKYYHKNAKNHFCSKKCESKYRKGIISLHSKKYNRIDIYEKYAIIHIENNFKGHLECIIDVEDVDKIKKYYWNIRYDKRHPNCTVYVETHKRINGKNTRIHLHRLITNCPKEKVVDHINHNGLDNRKCNLRIITQKENCLNRKNLNRIFYNNKNNHYVIYVKGRAIGRYPTFDKAIEKSKYINNLIESGQWNKLENLEYESIKKYNNGLQRNNKSGFKYISLYKSGVFVVRYKKNYLGTFKDLKQAVIKLFQFQLSEQNIF